MNQHTKGQVTIFIIIAVVIIAFLLTITVKQTNNTITTQHAIPSSDKDIATARGFLDACFKEAVESSLSFVEYTGSTDQEIERIPFSYDEVAVLVHQDSSAIPSLESLEHQLSEEILSSYGNCELDPRFPFELTQDLAKGRSTSTIAPDHITFTLNVPTKLKSGSKEIMSLGSHSTVVTSSLFGLRAQAEQIGDAFAQTPEHEGVPLNALVEKENRFPVYVYPLSNTSFIVRLFDFNENQTIQTIQTIDEEPQEYTFAVKR